MVQVDVGAIQANIINYGNQAASRAVQWMGRVVEKVESGDSWTAGQVLAGVLTVAVGVRVACRAFFANQAEPRTPPTQAASVHSTATPTPMRRSESGSLDTTPLSAPAETQPPARAAVNKRSLTQVAGSAMAVFGRVCGGLIQMSVGVAVVGVGLACLANAVGEPSSSTAAQSAQKL